MTNSADIEKFGRYRKTRGKVRLLLAAIQKTIGRVFLYWPSSSYFLSSKNDFINKIVINQLMLYWPSYGSLVCCTGPQPTAWGQYTAVLRPETGPIQNYLINNIII